MSEKPDTLECECVCDGKRKKNPASALIGIIFRGENFSPPSAINYAETEPSMDMRIGGCV